MKGGVSLSIDFKEFPSQYSGLLAQKVAAAIWRRARSKVRVKTRELMNSIKNVGISRQHFVVYAETPYAAMQEWGKPNTPYWNKRRYSYTPYMTPSAEEVMTDSVLTSLCGEVVSDFNAKMAFRKSRGL